MINYQIFKKEMAQLDVHQIAWKDRLFLSEKAHLTLQGHLEIENMFEESIDS